MIKFSKVKYKVLLFFVPISSKDISQINQIRKSKFEKKSKIEQPNCTAGQSIFTDQELAIAFGHSKTNLLLAFFYIPSR